MPSRGVAGDGSSLPSDGRTAVTKRQVVASCGPGRDGRGRTTGANPKRARPRARARAFPTRMGAPSSGSKGSPIRLSRDLPLGGLDAPSPHSVCRVGGGGRCISSHKTKTSPRSCSTLGSGCSRTPFGPTTESLPVQDRCDFSARTSDYLEWVRNVCALFIRAVPRHRERVPVGNRRLLARSGDLRRSEERSQIAAQVSGGSEPISRAAQVWIWC